MKARIEVESDGWKNTRLFVRNEYGERIELGGVSSIRVDPIEGKALTKLVVEFVAFDFELIALPKRT